MEFRDDLRGPRPLDFPLITTVPFTDLYASTGCITCKTKRLKCDETKPTCQQCLKRNVPCGGYKKDFKWRPFEEATFVSKPVPKAGKKGKVYCYDYLPSNKEHEADLVAVGSETAQLKSSKSLPHSRTSPALSEVSISTVNDRHGHGNGNTFATQSAHQRISQPRYPPQLQYTTSAPTFDQQSGPSPTNAQATVPFAFDGQFQATPTPTTINTTTFDDGSTLQTQTTASSWSSGQSPRLVDLLLPGTDMNTRPADFIDWSPEHSDVPYMPVPLDYQQSDTIDPMQLDLDDDVEEIVRQPPSDAEAWVMRLPSPSPSSGSSSSSSSNSTSLLFQQPSVKASSPEMLMLRFDRQTCGILSVKDGPTENPWRTLVWPLARDSPALYHAISSMTAFHTSKERPELRVEGIEHMRRSIKHLASGIQNMRIETALATTLVLAFSESWDQHISTGIQHLRGAKVLVNQALVKHQRSSIQGDELARLRFLCKTWIYMDVIARLTSIEDDGFADFDTVLSPLPGTFEPINEVDPLMGCGATLFPLIGRVANLIQKVRSSSSNSAATVSQAIELKTLIEEWEAPAFAYFDPPEDPTSDIQHSLQTAEAYRWATLLYLHQAVPEIPSESAAQLAKKVLVLLATVPLTSRALVIQIYPLLAASCEADNQEDRHWVQTRWEAMQQRLMIGNIDRCWEVIKEVWDRRDAFEAEKSMSTQRRSSFRSTPISSAAKRKFTVLDPLDEELELQQQDLDYGNIDYSWADSRPFTPSSFSSKKRAKIESVVPPPGVMSTNVSMNVSQQAHASIPCSSSFSPQLRRRSAEDCENMEFERTVRGRLHWCGVMRDWNWEGELFCPCGILIDCLVAC